VPPLWKSGRIFQKRTCSLHLFYVRAFCGGGALRGGGEDRIAEAEGRVEVKSEKGPGVLPGKAGEETHWEKDCSVEDGELGEEKA